MTIPTEIFIAIMVASQWILLIYIAIRIILKLDDIEDKIDEINKDNFHKDLYGKD